MNTTTNLLKRMAGGSSTVWNAFYSRYQGAVRGIAARMGMSPADQDEVVQETMLAAHRNLQPGAISGAQLHAWLKTVTRRKITDLLRRKYRRGVETELKSGLGSGCQPHSGLFEAREQEWQTEVVECALDRLKRELPVKTYQAFDLYVLREHEPEHVARTLGMSRALVYLHKLRVTEKLKREVAKVVQEWNSRA